MWNQLKPGERRDLLHQSGLFEIVHYFCFPFSMDFSNFKNLSKLYNALMRFGFSMRKKGVYYATKLKFITSSSPRLALVIFPSFSMTDVLI